jgi:hypothetical protein
MSMKSFRRPTSHLEILSLTRALQSKDPLHFSACFASNGRVISPRIVQHTVAQRQYGGRFARALATALVRVGELRKTVRTVRPINTSAARWPLQRLFDPAPASVAVLPHESLAASHSCADDMRIELGEIN